MTVRAWFTISALVVVALAAAFAFRIFAADTVIPEIRVRAGDIALEGGLATACWPEEGGKRVCETGKKAPRESGPIPPSGTLRVAAAYPIQPTRGSLRIRIAGSGEDVLKTAWKRRVPYKLRAGRYVLTAVANYPEKAFIRYTFRFSVSRSGN